MINLLSLIIAFSTGILLGLIFFGGLWWTVQKGLIAKNPALWFFISLLLRTTIVVSGFYFVAADHWQKLLACSIGFLMARFLVTRYTGSTHEKSIAHL